jgi:hypothetical protein
MVDLRLDPAGSWKNLKLRVDVDAYAANKSLSSGSLHQQPSAIYPSSSDSRSRAATAARIAFERALTSAKSDLTITSISELWVTSALESIQAYGGGL